MKKWQENDNREMITFEDQYSLKLYSKIQYIVECCLDRWLDKGRTAYWSYTLTMINLTGVGRYNKWAPGRSIIWFFKEFSRESEAGHVLRTWYRTASRIKYCTYVYCMSVYQQWVNLHCKFTLLDRRRIERFRLDMYIYMCFCGKYFDRSLWRAWE